MTPHEPTEDLTPEQGERVRRLLAEARHDEPMPAEVADRLDRVIAGLALQSETETATARPSDPSADRSAGRPAAGVTRLEQRRRTAGRLLLAAAVVVVGGVAVGQVVSGGGGDDSGANEGAADSSSPQLSDGEAAPPGGESEAGGDRSTKGRTVLRQPVQRVRSQGFATDARRLRGALGGGNLMGTQSDRNAEASGCGPGAWGGGRYLRVLLDGEPGWLVYRPAQGETQVVDLFLCGDDTPERSVTLPR